MAGGDYVVFRVSKRVWLLPFSQVILRKAFASPATFGVRIVGELGREGVEKVSVYSVEIQDFKVFRNEAEAYQCFLDWQAPPGLDV